MQLVEVSVTQDDVLLAEGLQEGIVLPNLVQVAEFVQIGGLHLQLVMLEPFLQYLFALLLYLAVVASQDGLYLSLCLCRAHEVDP